MLYRADQIAAVVDYDFVQERERLFDIAYALQNVISHLRNLHVSALRGWGDLKWANARMWVDHYDESAPLSLTEAERKWLAEGDLANLPREHCHQRVAGRPGGTWCSSRARTWSCSSGSASRKTCFL